MIKDEYYILYNGVKIPKIGFGTWQSSNEDAYTSTLIALKNGYRHIDTAYVYGNEEGVGRAIKESGIKREELFIVTKLPSDIKSYDGTIKYFNESLKTLGLTYLDLYLIHAPWPWSNVGIDCTKGNIEAWKAMIDLYHQGKVKAIGVSNFHEEHIVPLIKATSVKPMVNQIRFFIGNTQEKITKYCNDNNILLEAYSPLATGKLLNDKTIVSIANKYNVSVSKLCLRYCIERGTLPLPKSIHEERIIANLDVDFTIAKKDIEVLNSLHNPELDKPYRS